jgi:hypothetical protein
MSIYLLEYSDNITEAIHGLDVFTKNWCMNCDETEKQNDLVFRCDECPFINGENCLVATFITEHESNHPLSEFGSTDR